jgi:CheY-like chemotaxis protein
MVVLSIGLYSPNCFMRSSTRSAVGSSFRRRPPRVPLAGAQAAGGWRVRGGRRGRERTGRRGDRAPAAPDLVLLDIQLPDLDGFEVTARRADGEAGPVAVLTSTRDRGDYGERVARSGARGFIPKAELSTPSRTSCGRCGRCGRASTSPIEEQFSSTVIAR